MTRSKARSVILQAIVDHNNEIGDFPGYGAGATRLILERLEQAGMVPEAIPTTHGFLGDENGMTNEWEDEDET